SGFTAPSGNRSRKHRPSSFASTWTTSCGTRSRSTLYGRILSGAKASGARLSGASGGLSPLAAGFTDQVTACRCSFTTKRSTILWPCTESLSNLDRHGPKGGCCKWRDRPGPLPAKRDSGDRKSTRLNSSHVKISYAVFCLKKKKQH